MGKDNSPISRIKFRDIPPGFTLIETLVAVAIVAAAFSFGYASFREFSRRQYLESSIRSVRGDLRLAQEQALSGKKNCADTLSSVTSVNFDWVSPKSYKIIGECISPTFDISTFEIKTVTLPANISHSLSIDPIKFKVLGQGVETQSVITVTYGVINKTITVTKTGEIR